jgi:hypothetical protein
VIPLHLPPGDTSTERTLKIEGTSEQIESAKQLVDSILSGEVCFVPFASLLDLALVLACFACHVPSLVLL